MNNEIVIIDNHIDKADLCYQSSMSGPDLFSGFMNDKYFSNYKSKVVVTRMLTNSSFIYNKHFNTKRKIKVHEKSIFMNMNTKYILNNKKRSVRIVCGISATNKVNNLYDSLFIPFIKECGRFALVGKHEIRSFITRIDGYDMNHFDTMLESSGYRIIQLRSFVSNENKNLFIYQRNTSVDASLGIKIYEQHLDNVLKFGDNNLFLMCCFLHCSQLVQPMQISTSDIEVVQKCYHSSSFTRTVNYNLGLNIYQGKRSSLCNTSPLCGHSSRHNFQYNSKATLIQYLPLVEKLCNKHCASAVAFGRYIDPIISMIKNNGINHTSTGNSRIKIITCASLKGLPFCNTLHVDKQDMISDNMKKVILNRLHLLESSILTEDDIVMCKYIRAYMNQYSGISSGSRVTYHYVFTSKKSAKKVDLIQYFILWSLGVCIRISDNVTNYFYGGLFHHCSSVPLFIINGRVYVRQKEANVVAVGVAGVVSPENDYKLPLRPDVINNLSREGIIDECLIRGINVNCSIESLRQSLLSYSANINKKNLR